jgi:hypothetical protein
MSELQVSFFIPPQNSSNTSKSRYSGYSQSGSKYEIWKIVFTIEYVLQKTYGIWEQEGLKQEDFQAVLWGQLEGLKPRKKVSKTSVCWLKETLDFSFWQWYFLLIFISTAYTIKFSICFLNSFLSLRAIFCFINPDDLPH